MRILLADDHKMVRETIKSYLGHGQSAEVVDCGTLAEAETALDRQGPFDIVLLDLNMPGMQGIGCVAEVVRRVGEVPVAILTGSPEAYLARRAIELGARGFLHKSMPAASLQAALQLIAAGQVFIPYDLMESDLGSEVGDLTSRETQVLECLMRGLSNKEIAMELGLKEVTIKLYVQTLCRKLDVHNRTQAALKGRELLPH